MSLPPGKEWNNPTLRKELIGNSDGIYNVHQTPYTFPSYIEITFENRFIHPNFYFIEGRRYTDAYMLKSWEFEGKLVNGEWKRLHSQINKAFSSYERRIFHIITNEVFTGFRINMTDKDTSGNWNLCIGQFEVFGTIFNSIQSFLNHIHSSNSCFRSYISIFYEFNLIIPVLLLDVYHL